MFLNCRYLPLTVTSLEGPPEKEENMKLKSDLEYSFKQSLPQRFALSELAFKKQLVWGRNLL